MNRGFLLFVGIIICAVAGCGKDGSDPIYIPPDTGGDLEIAPTTLPVGMPGVLYSQVLSATGGTAPYAWSITSGSPPGTVSLDPGNGELSGTPDQPGTSAFTVTVADSSTPALSGYRNYEMVVTDGSEGWGRETPDAVLTEGSGWEAGAVGFPCVIKEAPDSYLMWYTASDSAPATYLDLLAADVAVGLATSADGVTWSRHAGNPVLTESGSAADPDADFAGAACVIKIGATYHMYYTGAKAESMLGYDYAVTNICHATSADGIAWTRQGAVLEGSVDIELVSLDPLTFNIEGLLFFSPWVVYDAGAYKMWITCTSFSGQMSDPSDFDAIMESLNTTIGCATSPDGAAWSLQGTAVLTISDPWEADGIGSCCVIRDPDENCFKMYYTGTESQQGSAIGFAKSVDGVSWTKSGANPVFEPSPTGWDSGGVGSPCVIKDLSAPCYRMWYTGSDTGSLLGRIGCATCPQAP